MMFISGQCQCGKTTLAKSLLFNKNNYYNWGNSNFKKMWMKSVEQLALNIPKDKELRLLLDEFHKNPKWKNQLKGFYDTYGDNIQIMVTGSAHLETIKMKMLM